MTTAARPWIECYLWGDGDATSPVFSQRAKCVEGAATSDKYLAAPVTLTAALDEWTAAFTAVCADSYSWTWNRSTNRITIGNTGTNFALTIPNSLPSVLGFTASAMSGASSFTGTLAPRGFAPLLAVECDPVEDAGEIQLLEFRSGRSSAPAFSNKEIVRVVVTVAAANVDALLSCCGAGRVRLHLTGSTSALAEAALGGYVDGWIQTARTVEVLGASEDYHRIELEIARSV
mgnify:FL=1|tara:strand:+ start:81 stop:776 length:696 start_codon:yes stop_codon:yes gene_type:complete